jgi:hypothetical protein
MEQFKTLEDLRLYLGRLQRWFGRPTAENEHPTLYFKNPDDSRFVLGIRRDDYLFSPCGNWVEPSTQHGLSFSASWRHLKGIYRLKQKHNPEKPVHVYWLLEKADIPSGLEFHPDSRTDGHYFLCVVERMRVAELRDKLIWVADRMSVIKNGQVAL